MGLPVDPMPGDENNRPRPLTIAEAFGPSPEHANDPPDPAECHLCGASVGVFILINHRWICLHHLPKRTVAPRRAQRDRAAS